MLQHKLDLVVVGGANTDFVVRGATLPAPGTTREGDEFVSGPGGKGANAAVAAAKLGAKVALIARLGADDRGTALLAGLDRAGVDTRAVSRDLHAATGVALVMVDGRGEKQISTAPGANHELSGREVADAVELIASAAVMLVDLEVPLEAVGIAVRLARAAGCRIVLDPAPPRGLSEELLRDVHVICPNAAEAEALTGVAVVDRDAARRAGENLVRRGVGAALVGAPGGNLLVHGDDRRWFPHLAVEVVDTTGAGDVLCAALALCIARGDDPVAASRFACAAAALKSTRLGAQEGLPDRAEVEHYLQRL